MTEQDIIQRARAILDKWHAAAGVTEQDIIQRARAILDKWHAAATPGPWEASNGSIQGVAEGGDEMGAGINDDDARLIVGMTDPDLWGALDAVLLAYTDIAKRHRPSSVNRIAAAIVSADEKMSA